MLPCDDGCSLFLKSTVMVKCEQRERESERELVQFILNWNHQTKQQLVLNSGKMFVLLLVENVV